MPSALTRKDIAVPKGVLVLFSCSGEQFSHESEKLKQGVFAHYLLKGIGGAAGHPAGCDDQ